jgi:dihydroorotase-like cyclic amidohydrolase
LANELALQPPITSSPLAMALLFEKTSGKKFITYIFSGALTPSSSSPFEIT